jgi:hypothetical protein
MSCRKDYQAYCSICDDVYEQWEVLTCHWCTRDLCLSCLRDPVCVCGEAFEDQTIANIHTPEAVEKIHCPRLKKRVMALHALESAEFRIQKIACGPLLGTRQKLYDMYMNGFLRSGLAAVGLREKLEERDHALFDELCGLYQKIKDAEVELEVNK